MGKRWIVAIVLILLLVAMVEFIVILFMGMSKADLLPSASSVVVIRVDDVIIEASKFTDRINLYKDDEDVKAFVLRFETPGGTVAASQELTNAIVRLRESGKQVVASIGNVGASGGYYAASQCDLIVTNPGSITGSIGVLMEHMEVDELTKRFGIKFSSITSGAMKDAGTIFRPMKSEERKVFEELIMDAYGQFRSTVLDGRRNAIAAAIGAAADDTDAIEAALDKVADGRILTGAQAVEYGLADEIGDLQDAVDIASARAGIAGEPNVIYDNPKDAWSEFKKLFGIANKVLSTPPSAVLSNGGLWYLYR